MKMNEKAVSKFVRRQQLKRIATMAQTIEHIFNASPTAKCNYMSAVANTKLSVVLQQQNQF